MDTTNQKTKLALFSTWDFSSPYAWSGVVHNITRTLSQHADLITAQVPQAEVALIDRVLAKASGAITNRQYLPSHSLATSWKQSKIAKKKIEQVSGNDHVLVSLAASTSSLFMPSDQPLIQIADSSFASMARSYFADNRLSRISYTQGVLIDKRVATRTNHYTVASEWSASVLMKDLGIAAQKITVIPFGPGTVPPKNPVSDQALIPTSGTLRLLLVASDWKRKGGDDALEIVAAVRKYRDVELTIVGNAPNRLPRWANHVGKVSRNVLSQLYDTHDLLLEPTQASAGGVVVTDAIAHQLPVIARQVGGLSTLIQDHQTGFLIENSPDFIRTATGVLSHINPDEIFEMKHRCSIDYAQRLNWGSWAQSFCSVASQVSSH
ncbi:glycosyltransferase family 4 protein [Rothia sp. ZJ932]|uniref:glycosyltransferase family 4 protein n=1 Tax=Rothia sp. ZJ932 TaxID=2810516 RepID=UPI001966E75A|nr:glycosyltransferase family 4 protein [Rothia sp. ZJ932]QRZ61212.1 glycosyltransferase family 4 protein [Rothia sp. ZJ932]